MQRSIPRGHLRVAVRIALAGVLVLVCARVAWAHIRLESSSPARDEVIETMPAQLRLVFSGRIERSYTQLSVIGPDGTPVAIGGVAFEDGSDRIITAALPPATTPGAYLVRWRTAGADGHVLEGSYAFRLAGDTTAATPDSASFVQPFGEEHQAEHDHHAHETLAVPEWVQAAARGAHFLALILLAGAITFRLAVVGRLKATAELTAALTRLSWLVLAAGALFLAAAVTTRLWLQSAALHGTERAWSPELLSIMLTDTSWGRAWVIQVLLFALLGGGIVAARVHRDRIAAFIALAATIGLCAIPALTGHAAGAEGGGWLIAVNDAVHVFAAGAWIGTLALLLIALPRIVRSAAGAAGAAHAVDTFSPLALTAAAAIVLTGVINTTAHLTSLDQLRATEYGRTLLIKVGFVALVAIVGFINWRFVRPRLRLAADVARLRATASLELLFALLVLAATAVLTGQPRP